jgi:hypothetical protein
LERLIKGDISRRQAAKELGIGYATLKRLLDTSAKEPQEGTTQPWPISRRNLSEETG